MSTPKPAQFRSARPAGADGKNDIIFNELGGTRIPGSTGLKAIPGMKVAWDWEGHGRVTSEALARLPPQISSWLLTWVQIRRGVQNTDITDVGTAGHWTAVGQRHHFMRHESQSEQQAYELGVKWIFDETMQAANLLKNYRRPRTQNSQESDWGIFPAETIHEHLGNALHALQDSFAPGHVERDKALTITAIHVYDKENKHPTAPNKLSHADYDKLWKGDDGKLSWLGDAAAQASRVLILFFALSALGHSSEANLQREQLLNRYLRANLSPISTQGKG
jgi:hypothetical protein